MPVKIQSVGKGKYRVSTPHGTKAKHTTLAKAKSQERLLNAVDHGWKPTGKTSNESVQAKAMKVLGVLLRETETETDQWADERPEGCKCPTKKRDNPQCPIHGQVGVGYGRPNRSMLRVQPTNIFKDRPRRHC